VTVLDAGWNERPASAFAWLYLHQGGRFDATSGLYHFRHRDYSPTLGRWTSLDPIRYAAGDVNLYRYVFNVPTILIDPTGLEGVGHHWVPVSVLTDPEIRKRLTDAAFEVGMGAYSGRTFPDHHFGTYGGISHARYNQLVRENLLLYMKENNIKRMGQEDMERFIKLIQEGRDYKGKLNKELKAFNDAIRLEREAFLRGGPNRGFREPDSLDIWRKRGQSYLKSPRFFGTAVGVIMAGWASNALAETPGALNVAGNSQHFRRGVGYLAAGDMAAAEKEFFGGSDEGGLGGFMNDLIKEGYYRAALNFQHAYYESLKRAQENVRNSR
jgi:RHS repeat-associated protein